MDRDPLVDSGVTGVGIGRVSRDGYKVVVVTTLVSVKSPGGQVRSTHYYAGAVSERIETGIASAQQQFEELVRKAIYVRRYYNQIRSEGRFPAKIPRYEDVPPEILEQTVTVPDHLDIVEIMDSFEATPWLPVVKTTGGDPVKLAVALQAHDLRQPHRNVYLNGFHLRFIERTVEGVTLYLPNELYRARGEWRTRIFHADGIEVDTVSDADTVGGWYDSLSEAWVYLISELRRLTAPAAENRRPAGNTILETGIRAVNLSGYGRKSRRDGVPRWRFTLGISQVEPSGREKRLVLASWRLATVTDEQIRNDLRRAAATSAYRRHLLENGASVKQAYLPRESVVPEEFWPEDPPCQIKADDLWYFAEQREGAKVA
ncbi:hypothetical protein [Marinobacter alkaliphilus]|uniref:Uncharacterized protein n=1 Tax=Marinobacter alkaliphilus TaxID=254719 RepID=A0ABZ3EAY3_9GAMM